MNYWANRSDEMKRPSSCALILMGRPEVPFFCFVFFVLIQNSEKKWKSNSMAKRAGANDSAQRPKRPARARRGAPAWADLARPILAV